MTRSFIMAARIITSKLNRKRVPKNTEKVKNTGQTLSSKWGCLWTGMEALRKESPWGFRMLEIHLLQ